MSIKILQLHKRSSYEYKNIQDKYAFNNSEDIFSLADGTTQSFSSEKWAEIITKNFVQNPCFKPNELIGQLRVCCNEFNNSDFIYSKDKLVAQLQRTKQKQGGSSTLIGVSVNSKGKLDIISCGDSNCFILPIDGSIQGYPHSDLSSLERNKFIINTESLIQSKIDESFFSVNSFDINYGDTVILATDALARLLIQKPSIFDELLAIGNFDQFKSFCENYWECKELQEDDISALIYKYDDLKSCNILVPPMDFSFPKEEEPPFELFNHPVEINNDNLNDMALNEIRNMFDGVAYNFQRVQKKQKLHEVLLMISISFLILIFIYLLLLNNTSGQSENTKIRDLEREISIRENRIQDQNNEIQRLNSDLTLLKGQKRKTDSLLHIKADTVNRRQNTVKPKTVAKSDSPKIRVIPKIKDTTLPKRN